MMVADRQARPWQLNVAVLALAVWWLGTYGYLFIAYGASEASREDIGPLLGVGFWTVLAMLLLLRTWQGGPLAYRVATAFAFVFGIAMELGGVVLTLMWLIVRDGPWWRGAVPMVLAGLPFYAARLLLSRPVRTWHLAATRRSAGTIDSRA